MATSQNGWPVASRDQMDEAPIYGTVKVPNGVLEGDVATVLRWVADLYHHNVEPLIPGTCWGWLVKPIEGGSTISNHASGTAIDLNANQHNIGDPASDSMSAAQVRACHAIVAAAGGVIRWGGDYKGRPDPMHWEIVGTRAEVAALAKQIRGVNKVEDIRIEGSWPLVGEGDNDNVRPGYDNIRRIQRQVGVKDDGVWGPVTTEAVGVKRMTEDRYRSLFGFSR